MIESLKAYLQVAGGITEVTRQRAVEVARQVVAASPAAGVLPIAAVGKEAMAGQVSILADELLAVSRHNREQLLELVRGEVEAVLSRLGLTGQAELEARLAASDARVRELERELDERQSPAEASTAGAPDAIPKPLPRAALPEDPVTPVVRRRARRAAAATAPAAASGAARPNALDAPPTVAQSPAKKAAATQAISAIAAASDVDHTPATAAARAAGTGKAATKKAATKQAAPKKAATKQAATKKAATKKATTKQAAPKKAATPAQGANS